jgi:diguanylate cyclase (GGDEF)-like protein
VICASSDDYYFELPSKPQFSFVSAWTLGIAYWALLLLASLFLTRGIGVTSLVGLLAVETLSLPIMVWLAKATWRRIMSEAATLAFKDPLTGLANRGFFMDRLREALARSRRSGTMVSVLFLDFDKFKNLNDTLGHGAGDALLREAGARFQKTTRAGEMAARLGGDEFTFLLEGVKNAASAMAAAARIQNVLAVPFAIEGHEVIMTASIGIALNEGPYCPADEMVRRADVALYQAKAEGRNCYRVFTPKEESQGFDSLELGSGLRAAVERNELVLYFQPEIDLSSGGVTGFEALVRWNHPRRGLMAPAAFVPIAEDSGLIRPLGKWVLLEACRVAVEVGETFPQLADCTVSVNVSPLEFSDPGFLQSVSAALEATGLDPQRLKLEIVETALMKDPDGTTAILNGLRDAGVRLAIDDFGTGYSSLSYLRRFPVNTLKIDRSFVRDAPRDSGVLAIMQAIVALARALGVDVTAEGIETREELALVMECGCTRAQGYLFARPLPQGALKDYLASQYAATRPHLMAA